MVTLLVALGFFILIAILGPLLGAGECRFVSTGAAADDGDALFSFKLVRHSLILSFPARPAKPRLPRGQLE